MTSANESDLCLFVIDGSEKISEDELNFINSLGDRVIVVINKSDLKQAQDFNFASQVHVSAKNQTGIDKLKAAIFNKAIKAPSLGGELNASAAQLKDIRESLELISDAYELASKDSESDIIASSLNDARVTLMRVLGLDVGDELLDFMFNRFCVGK